MDERRGAVEKAPGDAVQGVGEGIWRGGGSVPKEDGRSDGEEQLSAVLGQSEILRNRRRNG